jgi:hypothetical protein
LVQEELRVLALPAVMVLRAETEGTRQFLEALELSHFSAAKAAKVVKPMAAGVAAQVVAGPIRPNLDVYLAVTGELKLTGQVELVLCSLRAEVAVLITQPQAAAVELPV